MQKYNTLEELLKNAEYLVEDDCSKVHSIWNKWEREVCFKQATLGFGVTVGEFHGHGIFLSIVYYEIGGKVVVFWECTSMVANHYMIDDFFNKEAPQAKYGCANNFHCTIHEIQNQLNKQGTL